MSKRLIMPRKPEMDRWKSIHNRRPGEQKDCMQSLELRTPQEVANILGITRQRVQQIEREALFKLRRGLRTFWMEYNGKI